jgi:phage-related protein (TIGR01555 family)
MSATIHQLKTLTNQILRRANFFSKLGLTFGEKRDVYDALGYKKVLTYDDLAARYYRQDIAGTIVDAFPAATWSTKPIIKSEDNTFEDDFQKISRRLKLWHYFKRVDTASRIGQYAVLFIGVRDRAGFDKPISKSLDPEDILYLSVFTQKNAEVLSVVKNERDERFGLPETYKINFAADAPFSSSNISTERTVSSQSLPVHHSRVIHVAEDLLEDDIFGRPKLERVYNLLDDLQKVVGATGESFWLNAFAGFQAAVDKDMELDEADAAALSDEIDEYIHNFRRWIRTKGIELNQLETTISDPRGAFSVVMDLISGTTRIPQRILMGSERGQLASSQDESNWNNRVKERQESHAEVNMVRPFIDKLISWKALSAADYEITWPDISRMNEDQKAEVMLKKATAIKRTSEQGAFPIVGPEEARREIFGLPEDGAPEPRQIGPPGDDPSEPEDDQV